MDVMNINRKISLRKVCIVLLGVFFLVMGALTVIAQIYYKNNLIQVQTTQTFEKALEHQVEYVAEVDESASTLNWTMDDTGKYLAEGDAIVVYPVILQNDHDEYENVTVSYKKTDVLEGTIIKITESKDTDQYSISAQLQDNNQWNKLQGNCLVQVTFVGNKQSYVIPKSAVISGTGGLNDAVYIIKEEEKVWGTSYYLKKVAITVVESNGEYVAVRYYPGDEIVLNPSDTRLQDGVCVKY